MTCKDCIYFKRCVVLGVELDMKHNKEADKNCRHFKNKADFVEVVRMDEKEISKIKKAIEMIDDYLQEPNSSKA